MKLVLTIMTHSATPPKCSEGFEICNYGLTTTQQQAHNRTPAGFSNKFQNTNNNSNFNQAHTKTC